MLGALMSPTALYALGLGDIRLKSALNQPFDAEIELVDATAEDLAALRASIASSDTFVRYGLERPAFLAEFAFEVARGASGAGSPASDLGAAGDRAFRHLPGRRQLAAWPPGARIHGVARSAGFRTRAGRGRSPGRGAAGQRPGAPAGARADVRAAAAAAAPPQRRQEARTGGGSAAPSIEAGSTYRVQPNDTLWQIASAAHPGSRADVNRAMLAIYQANPQAFEGNINVLRAGSDLAIPDAATVEQIAASDAAAEVARQYRAVA